MNIEKQVCTFEQAKKLKELGVMQGESVFVWKSSFYSNHLLYRVSAYQHEMECAAYNVAELGEMLPDYHPSWRFPVHTGGPLKWMVTVICSPKPPGIDDIHTASEFDRVGDTQAEALAALLIALLETETITIAQVNERLKKSML